MFDKEAFLKLTEEILQFQYQTTMHDATVRQLHYAVGKAVLSHVAPYWTKTKEITSKQKQAFYLSAEYLIGRSVYSNLFNLGMLDQVSEALEEKGVPLSAFEDVEDAALGNGGLGRLAACFLDSGATVNAPLNGYGIFYRYGLFKQRICENKQVEELDDWHSEENPWFLRKEPESVHVHFSDMDLKAVPYDMPVIGYHTNVVNTLRLWSSEPLTPLDLETFNLGDYTKAMAEQNQVESISKILYPNDNSFSGKQLRLRQQYFFTSASLKDLLRRYQGDLSEFHKYHAIQLNDTHPVIAIPELIRLLILENLDFTTALSVARQTFSFTNHTVLPEALETWDSDMLRTLIPDVYDIIVKLDKRLSQENNDPSMAILQNNMVHMANLAIYCSHRTNGVAHLHTQILKHSVFSSWYAHSPKKFLNVTNGITPRRWLGVANPELCLWAAEKLGGSDFLTDLDKLKNLIPLADDPNVVSEFMAIKKLKKQQLSQAVADSSGVNLPPDFIFDIQIKRLHEYKRQLLNAFSILDLYYAVKEDHLQITPTAFIFGAKAASSYTRAKAVIEYIGALAQLINHDEDVHHFMRIVFIEDYNVSWAEKLFPAADVSEQISCVGMEASGTGNMKFMLNGSVTLGTYDGANIEIGEQAGEENNYLFGLDAQQTILLRQNYDPKDVYRKNKRLRRCVDSLIDGLLVKGDVYRDLYDSLLTGSSWQEADQYLLLADFDGYQKTRLRMMADYQDDKPGFYRKCLLNMAHSGWFSSDRSIQAYIQDIWDIKHVNSTKLL